MENAIIKQNITSTTNVLSNVTIVAYEIRPGGSMKRRMEICPLQWMSTIGSLSLRVVLIPLLICGLGLAQRTDRFVELKLDT